MEKERILVVEDDEDLSFILKVHLEKAGYDVDCAESLKDTEKLCSEQEYDLSILDVMLPDANGIEVCRAIRDKSDCPIIFASCIGERDMIIDALAEGGDDYLVKPVDMGELIARVQANLRRAKGRRAKSEKEQIYCKQFIVDTNKHEVWNLTEDREPRELVGLSPIEYKLLLLFLEKQDELILYEEMYRCIWGTDDLGDVRTVMVHISNLRKKIDESKSDMIHTVRGAGYIFSDK